MSLILLFSYSDHKYMLVCDCDMLLQPKLFTHDKHVILVTFFG